MKVLIIGDLHIKRSNLESSQALFGRVQKLMQDHDITVHLGDLYHDHGIVHARTQKVVTDFFHLVNSKFYNIQGNHDITPDHENSSLYVHDVGNDNIVQVMEPLYDSGNKLLFIPYLGNPKQFVNILESYPDAKIVFCHDDFNGAQFDNGFYAPSGIEPEMASRACPNATFIVGHIHKQQEFGRIWYPGTPRWLTKSDANQDKGLWSITIDDGVIRSRDFISSSDICPSIIEIDYDGTQQLPDIKGEDKIFVNYSGDDKDIHKKLSQKYQNLTLRVMQKALNVEKLEVSEIKGVTESIKNYIKGYNSNTDKAALMEEIFNRINT